MLHDEDMSGQQRPLGGAFLEVLELIITILRKSADPSQPLQQESSRILEMHEPLVLRGQER